MNTTTSHTRTEDDLESYTGCAALETIIGRFQTPEHKRLITDAIEKHGDFFLAFILGAGVDSLEPDALIETFDESHVLKSTDVVTAREGLAYLVGLQEGATAMRRVKEGADVSEVPILMDSVAIRERVDQDYLVVPFLTACYVFDLGVIRDRVNR